MSTEHRDLTGFTNKNIGYKLRREQTVEVF